MPSGGLVGSLISAGANLIGTGMSNASTATQNRKSRTWSQGMYDKQYQDSLAFWNMQNSYNTPEAQMNRFKQAGLNPNLIYGQGNSGNAGPIPTPTAQKPDFRPGDFSGIGRAGDAALINYMNPEIQQARYDNLIADNNIKLEEAELKRTQRENITQNTSRSVFDLNFDRELRTVSADARRENLRKLTGEANTAMDENERRNLANAQSLAEGVERILNMRGVRANLQKDAKLKQLDINLKKQGIQPGDAPYMRMGAQILSNYDGQKFKDSVKKSLNSSWEKFSNFFKK